MGLRAVSAVNAVHALETELYYRILSAHAFCSTEQSKPLDIGFRNASENSVISEHGKVCTTPG